MAPTMPDNSLTALQNYDDEDDYDEQEVVLEYFKDCTPTISALQKANPLDTYDLLGK